MARASGFKGMLLLIVCVVIGITLAIVFEIMYDNGWLIDRFVTGSVTLVDVQIGTIIVFVLVGIVISVFQRGK